ncbi:MAG: glutaredoxin family protein [Bacillota bacterium]
MITLYINPNCPFCKKTVEVAQEVGAPLTLKDIHDPAVEEELIRIGGKRQMPFMVDDESDVSMYESEDIMRYLHQKFGGHP